MLRHEYQQSLQGTLEEAHTSATQYPETTQPTVALCTWLINNCARCPTVVRVSRRIGRESIVLQMSSAQP